MALFFPLVRSKQHPSYSTTCVYKVIIFRPSVVAKSIAKMIEVAQTAAVWLVEDDKTYEMKLLDRMQMEKEPVVI